MDSDSVIQVITTEIDKNADTPGAKDYAKEKETSGTSKSPSKEELYGYLLCTERFLVDAVKKTDIVNKVVELLQREIQYIGDTIPQDKRFDYVADADIDTSSNLYQSLLQAVEKQCQTEEESVRKAITMHQEKLAKISAKYNEVVKKRFKQRKLLDSARRLYPTLFDIETKEGNTGQDGYKRQKSCQRDGRIEKRVIKGKKAKDNGKVGVFARSDDAAQFLKEVLGECIASRAHTPRPATPSADKSAPRQLEKTAADGSSTRETPQQQTVEGVIPQQKPVEPVIPQQQTDEPVIPQQKTVEPLTPQQKTIDIVMAVDDIDNWDSINPFDDVEIAVETQNCQQVDAAPTDSPQVVQILVPQKRMARAVKIREWAMRGSKASSSSPRRSNPEPEWVVDGSTMSWLTDQATVVPDTRVGGGLGAQRTP